MKKFIPVLIFSLFLLNSNLYSQLKRGGRAHEDLYFSVAAAPSWGIGTLSSSETYHGFDLNLDMRAGKSIGKDYIAYGNLIAGRLFGNLIGDGGSNNPRTAMPDRLDFTQITLGGGIVRYRKKNDAYYSASLGITDLIASQATPKAASNYLGFTVNIRGGFYGLVGESISMENGIGLSYSPLYSIDSDRDGSIGLFQMSFYIAMTID